MNSDTINSNFRFNQLCSDTLTFIGRRSYFNSSHQGKLDPWESHVSSS